MHRTRTLALVFAVALGAGSAVASPQITCPGGVTLAGTSADDDLTGTGSADRIAGQGGHDVIHGLAGSDCIVGGSVTDMLFGEDDNDDLRGEGGDDLLDGGAGDDFLDGGSNDDTIFGGPGNDDLIGEGGNDFLDGEDGDDTLIGGTGNDVLLGSPGDDTLSGEGGADLLEGGAGADSLNGGAGDDTLRGGPGLDSVDGGDDNDRLVVDMGDVPPGKTETLDGGNGFDTAVFGWDPGPLTPPDFTVTDPATGGTYHFINVEAVSFCGDDVVDPGEQCDDGNASGHDGCTACFLDASCGLNGRLNVTLSIDYHETTFIHLASAAMNLGYVPPRVTLPGSGPLAPGRVINLGGGTLGASDADAGNLSLTRSGSGSAQPGDLARVIFDCQAGVFAASDFSCFVGTAADTFLRPTVVTCTALLAPTPSTTTTTTTPGTGTTATTSAATSSTTTTTLGGSTITTTIKTLRTRIDEFVSFGPCIDSPRLRLLGKVQRAHALLQRAETSLHWRRFVLRVARILARIDRRSARLARRHKISPTCAIAIQQRVIELRAMIRELLRS